MQNLATERCLGACYSFLGESG